MSNIKTNIDPVLGIPMLAGKAQDYAPSVILYAKPGFGKTSIVAKSWKNILWVTSSPTTLKAHDEWMSDPKNKTEAAQYGAQTSRIYLPAFETKADGTSVPVDNEALVRDYVKKFAAAKAAGKFAYDAICFDEYTEIARRVYFAMEDKHGKSFGTVNKFKAFNSWICEIPRILDIPVVLICHAQEPKYDMEEGSPTYGKIKYAGGPMLPISTELHTLAASCDVCLRGEIEKAMGGGKIERKLHTEQTVDWIAKARTWKPSTEFKLDLRKLLQGMGYTV